LKWFGGEDLGASPWNLRFKPRWMCVLRYTMCIYIDISCINMIYETCMMVGNYFQNILLKNQKKIINIKSWHVFLSRHVVTKFTIYDRKKKKSLRSLNRVTWWCGMSIHVILLRDLTISMSIFLNYKLLSATCHYPKQL
jgi:hypothetical protein